MQPYNLDTQKSHLYLIPWGIETDIFYPSSDDRERIRKSLRFPNDVQIILSPRRIHPICNHDTILEAFAQLANDFSHAHLVLIDFRAVFETRNQLETQINHLGLKDRVHWLAAQEPYHKMADVYRMADIVISVPSSEGYGLSAFEAMACGTPTILSNLPVFENDVVDHNHALKVDARNPIQTKKAMVELLSNKKLWGELHLAGMDLANKKSTKNRILLTEQLYQTLRNTRIGPQ